MGDVKKNLIHPQRGTEAYEGRDAPQRRRERRGQQAVPRGLGTRRRGMEGAATNLGSIGSLRCNSSLSLSNRLFQLALKHHASSSRHVQDAFHWHGSRGADVEDLILPQAVGIEFKVICGPVVDL